MQAVRRGTFCALHRGVNRRRTTGIPGRPGRAGRIAATTLESFPSRARSLFQCSHTAIRRIRSKPGKLRCEPFLDELLEMEAMSIEAGEKDSRSHRRHYLGHLLGMGFELSRGSRKSSPHFFERYLRMPFPPEELMKEEGWFHPGAAPVAFLPARGFTNNDAKRLWDKASLSDKDELLLEWLRFVEPMVRDLRYISDSNSGRICLTSKSTAIAAGFLLHLWATVSLVSS